MNVTKPILWIIWIGLLSFIVFYRVAYGAEMPEKEAVNIGFVILVSVLLVGSLVSRVLFLPKQENLLPFFVFGLAAAEAAEEERWREAAEEERTYCAETTHGRTVCTS